MIRSLPLLLRGENGRAKGGGTKEGGGHARAAVRRRRECAPPAHALEGLRQRHHARVEARILRGGRGGRARIKAALVGRAGPRARALTQAPNAAQPRPAHTWLVWMPPSPSTSFHAPRSASAFHVELVSHRFSQPASAGGKTDGGRCGWRRQAERKGGRRTHGAARRNRAHAARPGQAAARVHCGNARTRHASRAREAQTRQDGPEQCAPSPSQHVAAEGRIFGPKEGAKVHSPNFSFR